MYGNGAALAIAIWGLSLVLLLTVSIVTWLISKALRRSQIGGGLSAVNLMPSAYGHFNELSIALEDAIKLNDYNATSMSDPSVHLGSAIIHTPLGYKNSAGQIAKDFREGRVLSVDLSKMDIREASRLVNFCSGMVATNSGWIFRVTDKVIVLTPA